MEDFSEEILLDVKKTVGEFCDASAACLAPEKVEACVIVKSNLALSRDMGFGNKWEINVWLIDWFLLASLTKWLILVYVEYWLLKNQKLKNWTSQNKLLWSMKSLRIQSFKGSWKSRKIPWLDFWESRDPAGAWNWNPKKWVNSDNSSRLRPLNQKNNLQVSQTDKGRQCNDRTGVQLKEIRYKVSIFISWYLKFQTKSVNQSRQDDQTKCLLIYITYLCITVQIHIRACWKNWLFPMRSLEKGSTLFTP